MENSTKHSNQGRGAQLRMREIEEQIQKFYESNPGIVEAMKLFQISHAEYEKALSTLYEPGLYTSKSTSLG